MSNILTDPFHVFAVYAAINGLIMLVLGVLVVRARVQTKTSIGDGGIPEMARPLRAHANNTEYTPMALLLIWATIPLGGAALIAHAIGLTGNEGPSTLRFVGMILTWIAYIVGIVACLWLAIVPAIVAS